MRKSEAMPKHVQARAAQNDVEENARLRKLARSIMRPRLEVSCPDVVESWAGKTPNGSQPE